MTVDEHDTAVAVRAEALYLLNLLLLPGLAFVALLWLARRSAGGCGELGRCHLRQTVIASLWAGFLLAVVALLIVLLGGLHVPSTWVVLILYFTCCHAALVLFGILGLSRAIAGQLFVYPLIGSKKW
ncbi:MAG TPA: hypothetical protein VEC01_01075 [Noviherbaspirillum sp.]|uniref:hypothetical protein n=1 Tax=Noviherbaspirillum sp. TaxID=1926288 RepID=UPI002D2D8C05|nr:hypothetical protein [Noviherbaspirillum sp.]HYD93886.1 hypothetical protein [Noviherbaspirillum sp.]